ncbi:MAG: hypothetical protein R2720_03765 [Candidatus Nanopelagicales bacterium]
MVVLMVFLAAYALTCGLFFAKLLRWTIDSERGCSCRGTLGSGSAGILHGPKMCYPKAEALSVH